MTVQEKFEKWWEANKKRHLGEKLYPSYEKAYKSIANAAYLAGAKEAREETIYELVGATCSRCRNAYFHKQAAEAKLAALQVAARDYLTEIRDGILNERGQMAEGGYTSDQINAVLAIIDDGSEALRGPLEGK